MASKQMILLTILCASSSQIAFGDVYKCTKNGTSTYSDQPCQGEVQVLDENKWVDPEEKKKRDIDRAKKLEPYENSNKNQLVSQGSVSNLLKKESEYENDSRIICTNKWTKRGELDNKMYLYCLKQQDEGYTEIVALDKLYAEQPFYTKTAFPHCNDKWTKRGITDTNMLSYCLKSEVEGMKDIMYFQEKYGDENVNNVAAMALAQFGSWNMAAYKVKQHFEER